MRRADHDTQWLFDGEKLLGINLGWTFAAEHEWNIPDLKRILNISDDESIMGIDRRRIGKIESENIYFNEKKGLLVVDGSYSIEYLKNDHKPSSELKLYENKDMATAWDGGSFGIQVKGEENIKNLKIIYEALTSGNAGVWLGGQAAFGNSGLIVAIFDRIPVEGAQKMKEADEEHKRLKEADEATGIKKELAEFNETHKDSYTGHCSYFALSPRWVGESMQTAYPVVYWLNPMNQDKNNYGNYTVEELRAWMKGEGPIPMKNNPKEKKKKK